MYQVQDSLGANLSLEPARFEPSSDGIVSVFGGRFIIKEIPTAAIDCTHEGCDEFAEFVMFFVSVNGNDDDCIAFVCSEHKELVKSRGRIDFSKIS